METSDDENSEGGDLVLDDPADGKELLKNGDFDDGIDDWEVNEGGQLSTTDDSVVLYGTHNWEANESGESSTTDDSVV